MRKAIAMSASCALLLGACARPPAAPQTPAMQQAAHEVGQPPGWADDLALPQPDDLNLDPHVLEFNLEAKVAELEILPGHKTTVWTYNGKIPGPLIRGQVGDRVIVHFKNSLPQETTIHWHGLRIPNNMDGAPGATQEPVPPGGEFTYDFTLRDPGTYWYHPHLDSSAQVGRGLYGAILVEDPNDPKAFGDDLVLLLSDMSLSDDGEMLPADSGGDFGDLFGREGAVVLVNGKVLPTLRVRAGKQQRWRIINATRARYYNVRLRNHRFMKLGGDNGLAARAVDTFSLLVVPGERADAVFTPADAPGSNTVLRWVPTERGYGSTFNRASVDMLKIETVADAAVTPEPIPMDLRHIEPIDVTGATERKLNLTIAINNGSVEMGVNGLPFWKAPPLEGQLGETQVWHITNNTDFAHPFHMHGYFFQVLDSNRVPEWKDTVNVPTKSELAIAVRFDERPGTWMFHCHILDHAEAGMMGHFVVRDPNAPRTPLVKQHAHVDHAGGHIER